MSIRSLCESPSLSATALRIPVDFADQSMLPSSPIVCAPGVSTADVVTRWRIWQAGKCGVC
jgi:hypothetical protein